MATRRLAGTCLQVYCGGPKGDFGFLTHLGRFLPLSRPVSVLDAGANLGGASILFSQLIGFNGEVVAVDANPMTFELLTSNLARLEGIVTPVKAAIVAHETALSGKTIAFSGDSNQYWGFRVEHTVHARPQRVVHQVQTKSLPMLQVCLISNCRTM
jgi:FkbM family methyltransferase